MKVFVFLICIIIASCNNFCATDNHNDIKIKVCHRCIDSHMESILMPYTTYVNGTVIIENRLHLITICDKYKYDTTYYKIDSNCNHIAINK